MENTTTAHLADAMTTAECRARLKELAAAPIYYGKPGYSEWAAEWSSLLHWLAGAENNSCVTCLSIEITGFGPGHDGSRGCRSFSIAAGGTRAHCTCDTCF